MTKTVWVDDWQMQCCGDPFQIGSTVKWTATPYDPTWVGGLAREHAEQIDYAEEHHDGAGGAGLIALGGTITSIQAVRCRFTQSGKTLTPITGSATFMSVDRADGWEEDSEELRFVGYLVEIVENPVMASHNS